MERGEDPAVDAEVGMPHVRAFDGVHHSQCDAPEVVWAGHYRPGFCFRRLSSRCTGHSAKARYNKTAIFTSGINVNKLSQPENPAFEKILQKGQIVSARLAAIATTTKSSGRPTENEDNNVHPLCSVTGSNQTDRYV